MKKQPLDESVGATTPVLLHTETVSSRMMKQKMGYFLPHNNWLVIIIKRVTRQH
jgi:hypothetical protein